MAMIEIRGRRQGRWSTDIGAIFLIATAALGCGGQPSAGEGTGPLGQSEAALAVADFGGWQQAFGGNLTSGPAALMRRPDRVEVFAQGTDGNLYRDSSHTTDLGVTWPWDSWQYVGGAPLVGAPSAIAWGLGPDSTAIVSRRLVNGIPVAAVLVCEASANGQCPLTGTWDTIPNSNLSDDPAIVYTYPYLHVIAPGTDHHVYVTHNNISNGYNRNGWMAWATIPDAVVNSGIAATQSDGILLVAARETDNRYYVSASGDGFTWGKWRLISTSVFSSRPALSAWSNGHIDAFGTINTHPGVNELFNATSDSHGVGWTDFQSIGGNLVGPAAACAPPNTPDTVQVFGTGTDRPAHLYRNIYRLR